MRYRRCLNSTTITQNTKHMWRRELQLKPITRFRKVKSKRKSAPSALTRIGFLTCHICGAQMLLLDCITLMDLLTWLLSSSIISICRRTNNSRDLETQTLNCPKELRYRSEERRVGKEWRSRW